MREERLNALLLLFIHKDIPLDYAAIVDDYAKRSNQRRMTFVNPLQRLLASSSHFVDMNEWNYTIMES